MAKILFPTDFSPTADHAFQYALRVAHKLNVNINTLHVYQLPDISHVHLPTTLQEVYQSIELEEFDNYRDHVPYLRQLSKKYGFENVEVKHAMVNGPVVQTILQVAKEEEAELIIMGTVGASMFKEIFLGSVAGEIMEKASCPVLAVPKEAVFDGRIDRIAITTEFKEREKVALRRVLDFARLFDAEVYCINVDIAHVEAYRKNMDTFKKDFEQEPKLQFFVEDGSDINTTIVEFLKKHEIDLLAMLTHRRNFFQELFNFSRAKSMSYHTNFPILAIPSHTL